MPTARDDGLTGALALAGGCTWVILPRRYLAPDYRVSWGACQPPAHSVALNHANAASLRMQGQRIRQHCDARSPPLSIAGSSGF